MKKKAAGSSKPQTRVVSLQIQIAVVGVDSNYDEATRPVFEYRQQHVYPKLQALGYKVFQFNGSMATRSYVSAALKQPNVEFFTGSGHGSDDRFTGSFLDTILESGNYNSTEVSGKIIHLLSCRTAYGLGADVVQNGCIAFFGYDTEFSYPPNHAEAFLACDAEIDFAIADGKTAAEAYDRALAKFDEFITHFDEIGDDFVVATLQQNKDHLCSPNKDSRWGDPLARI